MEPTFRTGPDEGRAAGHAQSLAAAAPKATRKSARRDAPARATLQGGADGRVWGARAALLIGGLLLVRLVYAAVVPLDLIHDEAYYWDWSRQLDWGYYSKPPMIAWIIAASTRWLGSTAFTVRLPAVLFSTGGLAAIYLLGRHIYRPEVGFWAAAAAAATPGNTVAALLMTIDPPLLLFWSLALYSLYRAVQGGRQQRFWWPAATVATGLGALSKQTMLGLLPLAAAWLFISGARRRELVRPAFWCYALGSLLFLAPVLWWNSRHNWITWQHTQEHFTTAAAPWTRHLAGFAEYTLGQAGVVSPVTAALMLALFIACAAVAAREGLRRLFSARRHRRGTTGPQPGAYAARGTAPATTHSTAQSAIDPTGPLGRRQLFLLCFSGVPLMGVMALSLMQRVELNWPAPFYIAAFVLLAGWARGDWATATRVDAARRWFVPGVAVGAVCCVITYALPFVLPAVGLAGSKIDPTFRMRGWQAVATAIDHTFHDTHLEDNAWIVTTADRAAAAELAFYLPGQPRVYQWNDSGRVVSQYDIWEPPPVGENRPAWIITPGDEDVPPALARAFADVELRGDAMVRLGGPRRLAFRVWRGRPPGQ